jgi:hypothetical protein
MVATSMPAVTPPIAGDEALTVVSGYVLSGGDTTPEGLLDAPRKFIYEIQGDDGSIILVTYTAFPPGPVGDKAPEIRLDFHAGSIQQGDYLVAGGTYETASNSLVVANEGNYIETYREKP